MNKDLKDSSQPQMNAHERLYIVPYITFKFKPLAYIIFFELYFRWYRKKFVIFFNVLCLS